MSSRILTEVSDVYWCIPHTGKYERAVLPQVSGEGIEAEVSWLDVLLDGGLVLPKFDSKNPRALTIMITGDPGSGKSTLAMELCSRWARRIRMARGADKHRKPAWETKDGWDCLYVSSELSFDWAREKAEAMGWETGGLFRLLRPHSRAQVDRGDDKMGRILLVESETLNADYPVYGSGNHDGHQMTHIRELALHLVAGFFHWPSAILGISPAIGLYKDFMERRVAGGRNGPEVVVLDSFDTLEREDQLEALEQLDALRGAGPRIAVFVMNAPAYDLRRAFQADLIIECGSVTSPGTNYLVRTIEIKKARFQSHAWGKQQLKIYGPQTEVALSDEDEAAKERRIRDARRGHPYRALGGIFIYPSIHYFLSKYKRSSPDEKPGATSTSIGDLDKMLAAGSDPDEPKLGFPRGRCTGLVGMRGGHKSHLGYRCILRHVLARGRNRGLVVSLRDDEGMAEDAIDKILKYELPSEAGSQDFKSLRQQDLLEVMYYPPGNITPEEMFHRLYLNVIRLKGNPKSPNDLIVLFNSLDQLWSRFPLCADERIFVPGIIETLSAEGITSIFIGVEEPGQPEQQYGLLSMADLLIDFHIQKISTETYLERWGLHDTEKRKEYAHRHGDFQFPTVARVVRFAGGQAAGASGMIELINGPDELDRKGLSFCALQKSDYDFLGSQSKRPD